ncbi:MAG: MiaB/RimO family radical SAM methylthiotransferase, partial [Eggerthellaceae bacterium]|nr:MiaB/RimO family radical SAM methylthiotransferase [Eggerthellaceae bacterium]
SCTNCIVHTARGRAVSMPREDILRNAETLLRGGANEVVLTGINLGSFHDGKGGLASLLVDLLALADGLGSDARFRLSSIEPTDIDEDLIGLMARENGRICRHLHIPLQSGSSKVLSEMNRRYTAEEFRALVSRLREAMPALSLTTDIIVGFPGETDDDFQETLDLARTCAFSKIHVFPYSIRANTPAAVRKDQIAPAVKQERARRLREVSDELRAADFALRVGTNEAVLVEGKGSGMTESYHKVAVPRTAHIGELIQLPLTVLE